MQGERLKKAQALGIDVEDKMMLLLMQYSPMDDCTVSTVKYIASTARTLAFDAMRDLEDFKGE